MFDHARLLSAKRLLSVCGGDDLADVPGAGGALGGFNALLRGVVGNFRRAAAAVHAGDVNAPAVFFFHQACAAAPGAVKQLNIMDIHGNAPLIQNTFIILFFYKKTMENAKFSPKFDENLHNLRKNI